MTHTGYGRFGRAHGGKGPRGSGTPLEGTHRQLWDEALICTSFLVYGIRVVCVCGSYQGPSQLEVSSQSMKSVETN
jgi:hypothetical protein